MSKYTLDNVLLKNKLKFFLSRKIDQLRKITVKRANFNNYNVID